MTAKRFVHTCVRVLDPDKSVAFYEALGYERRGKLQFETAYNIYMGLPGDGDNLELTVNIGREEPYDLGDGYNHIALTVDDLDALLADLAKIGVEPEKPPFAPGGREEIGRICFVQDPDGYRIELIDGGEFRTPQDP
jgi:lactoylglutathione lyase